MSYKDLEAEIRAWAQLEAYAHQQKVDAQEAKRQHKRDKRANKLKPGPLTPKPPKPELERPLKTYKVVTIECRPINHRKWGEPEQLTYEVRTMSDAVAEVEAIKQARADGYSFDKVVTIKTIEK